LGGVVRDVFCAICSRDIRASGRTFLDQKPERAVVVVKGVSVCAMHISSIVKTIKNAPR
jgi:hypothetical protein